MIRARLVSAAVSAAFCIPLILASQWATVPAYAQTAQLRPVISKPLAAAQDLMKAKAYQDALAKVAEADAVPDKTAEESYMIDRVRASIADVAGDDQLAIQAFEKVVAYNRLPPAEDIVFVQHLIALNVKRENYPKIIQWIDRYYKDGGTDPGMRPLLIQSYYRTNDFARTAQELRADIQAAEKAGKAPDQASLQLLRACAIQQNDKNAYLDTLEKFVTYYPNKDNWAELLDRSTSKSMLPERLALDLYRLRHKVGQLSGPDDYLNMSTMALLAGFPGEAKTIVDEGFSSGVLSPTADSGRYKRLRDQIYKKAAEDAKALTESGAESTKGRSALSLLKQGYAYVTIGQFDKGLAIMEEGMHQGGFKQPDDAKLLMAYAYILGGRADQAFQTLKTVKGTDGAGELARFWMLYLNHPAIG